MLPKILIGVVVLIIIVGGGYFVLKGNGAGDQAVSVVVPTPVAENTTQNNYATSSASEAAGSPAATAAPTPTPPTTTNPTQKVMSVTLHTNKGDITIEFYPENAPKTVANFIKLAQSGFYDKTKFHRVIKGFMDQGGDPLTKDDSQKAKWGTGGPGYQIPDEISAHNANVAGSVAMANSGPNTNGSQFFINAVDNHFLDPNYTVFGHVTAGMSVVTAINNVPTGPGDVPVDPVVINSVTVK